MQTILGAGGAIGGQLAKELPRYDPVIRLVSRHPQKVNASDELLAGDLLDPELADQAVAGSDIVYLTAGLDYTYKVWKEKWPVIMSNAIAACEKHDAKLVFFDNVYMYDPAYLNNLTEETPVNPPSKKGKVRAQIAGQLLEAIRSGTIQGMIVRAADFYGPRVKTSVMQETVTKRLSAGKRAMWMGNPNVVHSMTFTPDAAKATALLANTPDAWQQVWHLPTENERLTGRQWIEMFAGAMNRPPTFMSMPGRMIRFLGLFVPSFRELGEMMYQFDQDYFFNCEKFKKRFPDFDITPPRRAVAEIVSATSQS